MEGLELGDTDFRSATLSLSQLKEITASFEKKW